MERRAPWLLRPVRSVRPVVLDADLMAYYEAEAARRLRGKSGSQRDGLYATFRDLLRSEGRSRLVDVGAGPGTDTVRWQDDGFDVIGVDLAHGNVVRMRDQGVPGVVASLYQLPLPRGMFEALWTMSTFVHVPDARLDEAISELVRVVDPGSPLGIGTWGGMDFEGVPEFGELRPYRFFALRSHDRWRDLLAAHGSVEQFHSFDATGTHGWEYQFAVLRSPT